MPTNLSTDYGVYFFIFCGMASPRSELQETLYERLFLGYPHFVHPADPALWSKHDYNHCVHNTTVYLQKLKCKIKCTISDLVFITNVTRYGRRLATKCSVNPVKATKGLEFQLIK